MPAITTAFGDLSAAPSNWDSRRVSRSLKDSKTPSDVVGVQTRATPSGTALTEEPAS